MSRVAVIADEVVELINAGSYSDDVFVERVPVFIKGRDDIEELQVFVVASLRDSTRTARNRFEREYPIRVVADKAIDIHANPPMDVYIETLEQIEEQLENNPVINLPVGNVVLRRIENDPEMSGTTDSGHLFVTMTPVYVEIA